LEKGEIYLEKIRRINGKKRSFFGKEGNIYKGAECYN
jgi:hypothetical protein